MVSQKGALQAFFQENPYPDIAAREHLDWELAIPESRIQVGSPSASLMVSGRRHAHTGG